MTYVFLYLDYITKVKRILGVLVYSTQYGLGMESNLPTLAPIGSGLLNMPMQSLSSLTAFVPVLL